MAEQGPLTVEQEAELAELQSKVAQQKQKQKERSAKNYQVRKAAADRVVELEALVELGPLTVEQEAELAELQPKGAKARWRRRAAAARVAELEELAERGPLSEEQVAELVALRPKAQQQQKINESAVKHRRAEKAAADRVDAQTGEEVEAADVQAATGMWVIPVSEVEPAEPVVLPPSGTELRCQDGGSGLPTQVTGPKRRGGVFGPVAGKAGESAGRTRGEAGEGSGGSSGGS
ncbi:hypothetical protein [Saccharopolyspora spinosa]|uniref:hypothetical protein n=1 Tax=Saccharopolyspora spinosa TaxID=60894 RepID=UPI000237AB6D|nr:hypothetical protein [Saccharopolyspora spinosa]